MKLTLLSFSVALTGKLGDWVRPVEATAKNLKRLQQNHGDLIRHDWPSFI